MAKLNGRRDFDQTSDHTERIDPLACLHPSDDGNISHYVFADVFKAGKYITVLNTTNRTFVCTIAHVNRRKFVQ